MEVTFWGKIPTRDPSHQVDDLTRLVPVASDCQIGATSALLKADLDRTRPVVVPS